MHGLGNDFMVVDAVSEDLQFTPEQVRAWADRKTGIGFDQLLVLDLPTQPDADFWYRIFNADGTEAEQCGNGARCITTFAKRRKLTSKDQLRLQTLGGPIVTRDLGDRVEVNLGPPSTEPADIPFVASEPALSYTVETTAGAHNVTPVSVGNPHAVTFVTSVTSADVGTIGALLTRHANFPEGANIGFCQIIDRSFVRLRVFERGVGETRACGSGACAAVVASRLHGFVDESVKVALPGGKVHVTWQGPGAAVTMTGPSTLVYEGSIRI
jgi:diaminopimelate epimerase